MTQCSLADKYQRFRGTGACIFKVVDVCFSMMKVAGHSSETSVPLCQMTLHTPQNTKKITYPAIEGLAKCWPPVNVVFPIIRSRQLVSPNSEVFGRVQEW
jgi:hypothetical protein